MLYYHHTSDIHANAYGNIVSGGDCTVTCNGKGLCAGTGIVDVTYQFYDQEGVQYNDTAVVPDFCEIDCCHDYIASNITVYFLVENGFVEYTVTMPNYSTYLFAIFGIISLIMACICGLVSVVTWKPTREYQTLISDGKRVHVVNS